jgi:F-type H+-transporting ATPase subunit a
VVLASAWTILGAPRRESGADAPKHDASAEQRTGASQPQAEHGAPGASATEGAPAHGQGAAHGEDQGPQKFPNVITLLVKSNPGVPWAEFLHHYEAVVFSLLVAGLICLVAFFASRNPKLIPDGLQNVVETLVEALNNFIIGVLGPVHGPRFVPFLGTLFIYILAMNLFGLFPLMDSPTSSLNVTVGLAITVFCYVQYVGMKELGVVGYVDHLLGSPRTPVSWLLVPIMLPVHVLGEFAKPISLSCRLFGNVFGEDMLLVAFATLGVSALAFSGLPVGLPLQLPFLFLALLTSTLQALIFTILSTIYFLLMLPHDHGHAGTEAHAH